MKRNLHRFSEESYDLLVIGGGIYGACAAWDAALRGLSVALVEQGDFGHATSANSQKIIHGGLRYLQTLDLKRMRESIRERRTLLRVAPHLVHPMTCLMPTRGHGKRSRTAMRAAFLLNDLISLDRNRGIEDPAQRIPACRIISRQECLQSAPGLRDDGLTGGAVWHDAQIFDSERLTLAFVLSAVEQGAIAANYVRVAGFLRAGGRVTGVTAVDVLSGNALEIRARVVLNTSGPWVDRVLSPLNGAAPQRPTRFVKAVSLVTRRLPTSVALGLESRSAVSRSPGLLFLTPWRDQAVIGTTYAPYAGDPARCRATEEEIEALLKGVNWTYPSACLTRADVLRVHVGLVPADGPGVDRAVATSRYRIVDHAQHGHGVDGLISIIGVKYTTARDVAEKAVNRVFDKLARPRPRPRSRTTPLIGGQIARLDPFLAESLQTRPPGLSEETMRRLVYCHGATYPAVLRWTEEDPGLMALVAGSADVIRAEVVHAVHEEMAVQLADVVYRRTDLGIWGVVEERTLQECSAIMAEELGWSEAERFRQVDRMRSPSAARVPEEAVR